MNKNLQKYCPKEAMKQIYCMKTKKIYNSKKNINISV